MRKLGYIIDNLGSNNLQITSLINFDFINPPPPGGWTALTRQAFMNFVIRDIQGVWNSEYNRGLQPPFSSTQYSIRTNIAARIVSQRPRRLTEGEIYIQVFAGDGTSYIGANPGFLGVRATRLYPDTDFLRCGRFYTGSFTGPNPVSFGLDIGGATIFIAPQDTDYTFAHEFGHVLGLADRYTSICNIDADDPHHMEFRVSNHSPTQYPIYLPGFYKKDQDHPGQHPERNDILADLPSYDQAPFNDVPGHPGIAAPQEDYNKNPYDVDYSVRFGWMHNIMSTKKSPHNFFNQFMGNNATYEFLYKYDSALTPATLKIPTSPIPDLMPNPPLNNPNLKGSACILTSEKTIIITKKQIEIILNKHDVEFYTYGQIFEKFIYTKNIGESGKKEPNDAAPLIDNTAIDKFFLNQGSFLGMVLPSYDDEDNYHPNAGFNIYNRNGEISPFPQYGKSDLDGALIVSDERRDGERVLLNNITGVANAIFGTNNTCTITTAFNHNLSVGNGIHVYNATNPAGLFFGPVTAIISAVQFTINTPTIVAPNINIGDSIVTPGNFTFIQGGISGATNANPIVITTATNHSLKTGDTLTITNVVGNIAANVVNNRITVLSSNTFSLDGVNGLLSGTYTGSTNDLYTCWQNTQYLSGGAIIGATNANPIVITTANPHGLVNNDLISISGIGGNLAANVEFRPITVLTTTTFSINNITGIGSGAYAANTGFFWKCKVNYGIEDVMDYRMSDFNNASTKKIWTPYNKQRRIGEIHGFFSLYINNNRFAFSDFLPASPSLTSFTNNVDDITVGDIRRLRFLQLSRLATQYTPLQSDRLDNVGYFSDSGTRFVWNHKRVIDLNSINIVPITPPLGYTGIYSAPTPLPRALLPGTSPPDQWYPGSFEPSTGDQDWHYNERIFSFKIYYNRLDFILIP
jgi:hypothetical protein